MRQAWRTFRQQQLEMLTQRFHEADRNGDKVLSINEFWDCLQALPVTAKAIEQAAAANGAAAAAAPAVGPLAGGTLDRARAEGLFNEVLLESERLGTCGCEGDTLSVESFTTVLMRHGIYDDDYERFDKIAKENLKRGGAGSPSLAE